MTLWFGILQIAVGAVGAVLSLVVFARRRGPNDFTMGAALLLGVLLLIQMVVAAIAPIAGNPPRGDLLEFWMYLITATALPFGVGVWALIDRKPTANLVLTVMHVAVAIMVFRMLVIWG